MFVKRLEYWSVVLLLSQWLRNVLFDGTKKILNRVLCLSLLSITKPNAILHCQTTLQSRIQVFNIINPLPHLSYFNKNA